MVRVLLGTSGWSYEEWVGPFYPSPEENKLAYYSKVFDIAEIDSTFYSYPSKGMVLSLLLGTCPGFVFTAKVPREITHKKKLDVNQGVEEDLKRFCELMEPLNTWGKLGCLLIQLHPRLEFSPQLFEDFLQVLPPGFRYAVEFRHPSWLTKEAFSLLEKYEVAYTVVDEPHLPPEVHVTARFAYLRWHGRGKRPWYNYRYKIEELEPWVPRVRQIADQVDELYGFFNNHFSAYAVENCLQMLKLLGIIKPEQEEALRAIEEYREKQLVPKPITPSLEQLSKDLEDMTVDELLTAFMDARRLRRAVEIPDEELEVFEASERGVEARIRDYSIHIDAENRLLVHDCADWSRCAPTKTFCKHVGKLMMSLPEEVAARILRDMWENRDAWRFKEA